ncbi:MAG TPA: RNA 2',3'-cyclic phosphodiesterase [Bacillota bacterium]|nr:RNA 2',3'-cyclic phosphodiesterase [Bacillota bacterium]HOK68624.1 RNA 2',3'-cyclic phosphodiesterase [Bacillota bacterium]HPP84736.1 RNA 2',3'-cyclic phosphodiesterase [Bacillota bacterium]
MRLFTAILFTPEIKKVLTDHIAALKIASRSGNFTLENNLHLTINFIGETDRVEDVKKAMSAIRFQPFTITLGKSGVFRRSGGDIYWLGIAQNPQLDSLHKNLFEALRAKGFTLENRDYKPHITLGREVVLNKTPAFSEKPLQMTVSRVSLMKSERIGGKLVYTEIFYKNAEM